MRVSLPESLKMCFIDVGTLSHGNGLHFVF